MKPSRGSRLTIHQRLHSEADAVYAQGKHGGQRRVIQLPRGALQGDLGSGCDRELVAEGVGQLPHQGRGKDAGGAPSQVDAVHLLRNEGFTEALTQGADFATKASDILLMSADRGNAGGKVAVGAFGAAKGDRNVNTERIHPPPAPSCYLF